MSKSYHYNLSSVFADVVRESRDRTAIVIDESTSLTYGDLDVTSNKIAHFLLKQQITKRDRISIVLDKSVHTYSIILAAIKIGAPYFVVDPRSPLERARAIIEQCDPKILFVEKEMELPQHLGMQILCDRHSKESPFYRSCPDEPPKLDYDIDGSDPVYIMFTSGSTGLPKGAVMSNNNLINFIQWSRKEYQFTKEDVFSNLNPLYFDNSVFDIYSSLFLGATLVAFDSNIMTEPHEVVRKLNRFKCNVVFAVPSFFMYLLTLKMLKRANLESVGKIIFGGEGFPKIKLKKLFDEFHRFAEIYNVYGPTECTCICSNYRITAEDFSSTEGIPPIGYLIGNFSHYVLNGNDPAQVGQPGELCLGGPCVGLGYYNQPDLTEKAFVQNPLNKKFFERIYRTGDMIVENPDDGKIYFVGRRDLQIKHQGYRIELEEIQYATMKIHGIDEAVALHGVRNGVSEIIVVVASKEDLEQEAIKRALTEFLPSYMIPSKIFVRGVLPKNANGKIDRQALMKEYGG
jgi:D-alanine--poly(phosphoribitol) ligase subunit 1